MFELELPGRYTAFVRPNPYVKISPDRECVARHRTHLRFKHGPPQLGGSYSKINDIGPFIRFDHEPQSQLLLSHLPLDRLP